MELSVVEKITKKIQTEISRPIVKINKGMLAEKIRAIPPEERGNFWTLYTRTEPQLTKKSRLDGMPLPYTKVFKFAIVQLQINVDYEKSVNARRAREGKSTDFKAQERVWGTHAGGSLLTHTPKGETEERKYIELPCLKCLSSTYEDESGNPIEGEDLEYLKTFLSLPRESKTQGLENELIWRTYKLDSIISVAANHIIWQIVD